MKIKQRNTGDITILEPKGKIMIGSGDAQLRDSIDEVLNGGSKRILVNLKGVSKMDSSGLGELVAGFNAAGEQGGTIKLSNLPSKIYDVFGVAQMLSVFDVYDDESEALASFEP